MWDVERKNYHQGTYMSASMLAGNSCERQTWFERQPNIELYEIPRRRYWPFRGTIVHHMIENINDVVLPFGWIQELRLTVPLVYPEHKAPVFGDDGQWTGGFSDEPLEITLGGTVDTYNPYRRELHDFKTLSDLRIPGLFTGQQGGVLHPHIKDEWVWQTNIYAWLLSKSPVPELIQRALEQAGCRRLRSPYFPSPRRIRMQVLSMMELPLTGTPYVTMGKDRKEGTLEDVPILPHWQIEAFVRERALRWYRWLVLGEQPPVVDEDRKWMCAAKNNPCPFNGELHAEGVCFPTTERLVTLARAQSSSG
jgi:hypothetical protein